MNSWRNYYSTMFFSLFGAIILTIIPLPFWASWLWPNWVLLVLIYWLLNQPQQMGVSLIFILGVFIDLLQNTPLGEHALIFLVVSYPILKFYARINFFSFWQKLSVIFAAVFFAQLLEFIVAGFFNIPLKTIWYWLAIFSSVIIWYWLEMFLHNWQWKIQ